MLRIKSDESDYISYLSKNYPKEEFTLGRSIRCGEIVPEAALGAIAYFIYFGKNAVYLTPLDPVNLDYIETIDWAYSEEELLGICLGKTTLEFAVDLIFLDDDGETICYRQFTSGRFDLFNKFNRKNYAKLLDGKSKVLLYKSASFDGFMEKIAKNKGGYYEPLPLGFQVDQ